MKPKKTLDMIVRPIRRLGLLAFSRLGEDLPDVVVLDPERGVICIELLLDQNQQKQEISASKKISNLRREIPEIRELPRHSVNISVPSEESNDIKTEFSPSWIEELPASAFDSSIFASIASRLNPTMTFERTGWDGFKDENSESRSKHRIRLDKEQNSIAISEIADVKVLTGPAGSGKSLVLAARAKYLASNHPDWKIQVLCYNRILAAYLSGLLGGHPQIQVSTYGRWLSDNGFRMGMKDGIADLRSFRQIQMRGTIKLFDALLVDEIQDFFPAWISLSLLCLSPNRGGALLVGDKQQQLYRDANLFETLKERNVDYAQLEIPYRSTKQILDVVSVLDPEQTVPGSEVAPPGNQVDLIWSASSPDTKAQVIEFLTSEHIDDGTPWGKMAVLVASKYAIGPIASKLRDLSIPCEPIWSNAQDFERDMASDTLKIMTMNSAKGLEFSVVFLVGLDEIKHPTEGINQEERLSLQNRARLNLVGPTRAQDVLHILYSKENTYIQRLRNVIPKECYFTWPDDFEVNTNG